MKLKEFLKPNLGKIIIFFIILLIWSFIPLIPYLMQAKCLNCSPKLEFTNFYTMILYILDISNMTRVYWNLFTIPILFTEILISYILSCLIYSFIKKGRELK